MILSLWWKEYREQRSLWLAVAVLAVLAVFGIGALATGGVWQARADESIRFVLMMIVASLAIAHGVVCGAMLLAGEKETGTLVFLDTLAPQRNPVWRTKLVMGATLALAQGLLLAGLAAALDLSSWDFLATLVLLAVVALAFGMAGGTMCKSVFPAVVVGFTGTIVFLVVGVILTQLSDAFFPAPVALAASGIIAGLGSWQGFCQSDRTRTPDAQKWARTPFPAPIVVTWLVIRQGRWIIAGGLAFSVLAGSRLDGAFDDFLWAATTFALGLMCGAAAFGAEQPGQQEFFLGSQRVPPGRFWGVKTSVWACITLVMMVVVFTTYIITVSNRQPEAIGKIVGPVGAVFEAPSSFVRRSVGRVRFLFRPVLFLADAARSSWQPSRLAALTSSVVLTMWLPSMFFGGLSAWQVLGIPVFFLLATPDHVDLVFGQTLHAQAPLQPGRLRALYHRLVGRKLLVPRRRDSRHRRTLRRCGIRSRPERGIPRPSPAKDT